jgi:hypothetical protein
LWWPTWTSGPLLLDDVPDDVPDDEPLEDE